MAELLTSAQMRAIEAAAIASGSVTGLELMERAGRGVVEAIFAEWPELAAGPFWVVVLCGPGNNGGDGFVVARLLREWGWEVEVFLYGDAARMPPDAATACADWGGPVLPLGQLDWPLLAGRPLVIDAMFGNGLSRPVEPGVWGALDMAQSSGCRVVAIDIVSGICADSGRVLSAAGFIEGPVDLTVTFDRLRPGHMLAEGGQLTQRLVVADIGLGICRDSYLRTRDAEVMWEAEAGGLLQKEGGHKYAHGHAMVLAGAPGHGGAARLAARGALRIGAGLVTVGCVPEALAENAARLDAVMLREVADGAALEAMLEDRRINAVCVGPGLGVARAAEMLGVVLPGGPGAVAGAALRSTVIDADGLTALAGDCCVVRAAPCRLRADAAWRGVCAAVPRDRSEAGGSGDQRPRLFQGGCDAGGRPAGRMRGAVQRGGYGDCRSGGAVFDQLRAV